MVAEEFEIARFAATLVAVEYEEEEAVTDLDTQLHEAYDPPKKRMESMAAAASRAPEGPGQGRAHAAADDSWLRPQASNDSDAELGSRSEWTSNGGEA